MRTTETMPCQEQRPCRANPPIPARDSGAPRVLVRRLRDPPCARQVTHSPPAACQTARVFDSAGPTLRELAEQAWSSTQRGYDLLAPKFDHTPFRTPDSILLPAANTIAARGTFTSALDVCCGTGAAMRVLRPHARGVVHGLDFSEGMLAEAVRRTADSSGTAALRFVRGDALALPYDVASFDLATLFGALGHILPADEQAFVHGVYRILRPGGRFVFATSTMPSIVSPARWILRGFNAAMHVRNAVRRPPFVMFYLTFLMPEIGRKLEEAGFTVEVEAGLFPAPFGRLLLVTARKP